jgi:hypothetical protein
MRVLVCGGRDYQDREHVAWVLAKMGATVILEPGTLGAPYLAAEWARQKGVEVRTFRLDPLKHGRAAGVIRKQQMIADRPDLVIIFPGDDLFTDIPDMAREAGIEVLLAGSVSPPAADLHEDVEDEEDAISADLEPPEPAQRIGQADDAISRSDPAEELSGSSANDSINSSPT